MGINIAERNLRGLKTKQIVNIKNIMKEIFYQGEENPFILTNKEFFEAMQSWGKRKNYWCKRLDILLGPFIRFARPSKYDKYGDILLIPGDKYNRKYIKSQGSGEVFEIISNGKLKIDLPKKEIDKMISMEDFYNKTANLLKDKN